MGEMCCVSSPPPPAYEDVFLFTEQNQMEIFRIYLP